MNYPAITIDKDVPMDGTFPLALTALSKTLTAMIPGDSFFFNGLKATELSGLVAYAKTLDVPLFARDVTPDLVYFQSGVRVWRGLNPDNEAEIEALITRAELEPSFVNMTNEEMLKDDPTYTNQPTVDLSQPKDDKRKFYVIESATGNHFAWGSTLPLAEQKMSEERQKGVRLISYQQFMDLENKNYTMHYWINSDERRYFFITSCLNTNASFNMVGCKEVDYDTYQRFALIVEAGLNWESDTQYVRRVKLGDCVKLNVTKLTNDDLRSRAGDYQVISKAEFDQWEMDNEL